MISIIKYAETEFELKWLYLPQVLHSIGLRSKVKPYLYNGGDGKWIHCVHLALLRLSCSAMCYVFS